jgi:fatty acid desaturase
VSRDQGYGFAIFIVSIIIMIIYLVAFFALYIGFPAYLTQWAIGIPVLLFVLLVLVIAGWIGWTMLTTPPPLPIEAEPKVATPERKTRSRPRARRARRVRRRKA